MVQEERLYEILNRLKEKKVLSAQEVMQIVNVSRDTARRDIVKLVRLGMATRTHGGITLSVIQEEIKTYKKRMDINSEEKLRLGKYAANYLQPGKVCFLDVSTTIQSLCSHIDKESIIFTHSLDNVEVLSEKNCEVHLLGGRLEPRNRYLYGSKVLLQLEEIYFDIAVMGAAAIDTDGIYIADYEDALIKKKVVDRAAFVCVVADGGKFSLSKKFKAFSFHNVDLLITTQEPPNEIKKVLSKLGTKIEII